MAEREQNKMIKHRLLYSAFCLESIHDIHQTAEQLLLYFNNKIIKKEESVIVTDCNTHHDASMSFITLNLFSQLLFVEYRVIQYMLLKACVGVNAKLKHAFNSLYYVYKWSTK